jgi:hypothetical protein
MVVYDDPNTPDGMLCVGYYGEAFFQAMLWEKKRQDLSRPGPQTANGTSTFATFVDEREVIDSGHVIRYAESIDVNEQKEDEPPGFGDLAPA